MSMAQKEIMLKLQPVNGDAILRVVHMLNGL